MKISIIHNLYQRNPYVNQSVRYNISALELARIDYQYILFNDKGDEGIYGDIKELLNKKIEYHYSKVNYGQGKCSGGWVGAIPLLSGDVVHNTGQDDVFSEEFYRKATEAFSDEEVMFFSCNGIRTDEHLNRQSLLNPPEYYFDYSDPLAKFKEWFGVIDNEVTRANNGLLAPGTLYRRVLHDHIGKPSISDFLGASDFEYWSRILFNGHKGKYENSPLWLYRVSDLSVSEHEKSRGIDHRGPYLNKIKEKYRRLWKEKTQ